MANQFLQLSLFLMLLSFFIVLNGMSAFEENKVRPVMNSLLGTFSNDVVEEVVVEDYEMGTFIDDNQNQRGDTLEEIEGLFDTHISGIQTSRSEKGDLLHIRMQTWKFQNAITSMDYEGKRITNRNATQGSFLDTMISLLRSDGEGKTYRVDLVISVPKEPAVYRVQSPRDFARALRQVTDYTQIIESAGFPRKMISAGMGKGASNVIDLYFRTYVPYDFASEVKSREGE